MFIFRIIGWVIVIWLFGSTIYSTQFHLRNYLRMKEKSWIREPITEETEDLTVQEIIKKVSTNLQHRYLRRAMGMQFIKLLLIILLLYFLIK